MVTLRQDQFNWLPGATTVLQAGHEVWVVFKEIGEVEVEITSTADCKKIQDALVERGGAHLLTQDLLKFDDGGIKKVTLWKDYKLSGADGKGEVPGDLLSWWKGSRKKKLTFLYSPREKIQRMIPEGWRECEIEVDEFTFKDDDFPGEDRPLGKRHTAVIEYGAAAPVSDPLNLRRDHGVILIGVVYKGEVAWAPPAQQLVGRGAKGLLFHRKRGVLLQDEDLEEIAQHL
eukprot:NODE_1244_length_1196_cov_368.127958.p1 GENE.NODE_1244_length_1196_cov_368.127958~~NODE_1244_length_1196_cov_368.127958.p1  ORF type:complete len:239 (-),score=62.90 NODE_1244_length_1196_cov_368.127958:463-1152(-)